MTVTGGNPSLSPERHRVMTIGLAVTPTKSGNLRVSLDYLATRTTDQTGSLGSATAAFQVAFPDQFQRDASDRLVWVDPAPGQSRA